MYSKLVTSHKLPVHIRPVLSLCMCIQLHTKTMCIQLHTCIDLYASGLLDPRPPLRFNTPRHSHPWQMSKRHWYVGNRDLHARHQQAEGSSNGAVQSTSTDHQPPATSPFQTRRLSDAPKTSSQDCVCLLNIMERLTKIP